MAQTLYTINKRLGSSPTISYDVDNQNSNIFRECNHINRCETLNICVSLHVFIFLRNSGLSVTFFYPMNDYRPIGGLIITL